MSHLSNIRIILGNTIRNLRNEHGWSQDELAHKIGVYQSHIGKIERGEVNVTIDSLEKLVNAFGISFEELFRAIQLTSDSKDTSVSIGILNKLSERNINEQKRILKILDELLKWKDE